MLDRVMLLLVAVLSGAHLHQPGCMGPRNFSACIGSLVCTETASGSLASVRLICVLQAIGAEGVVAAQCRSLVKAYLPQLIKIIATMPSDQVRSRPLTVVSVCSTDCTLLADRANQNIIYECCVCVNLGYTWLHEFPEVGKVILHESIKASLCLIYLLCS